MRYLSKEEIEGATLAPVLAEISEEDYTEVPPSSDFGASLSIPKAPKAVALSVEEATEDFYRSSPGIWLTCNLEGRYVSKLFRSA
jgi:hypothetical protein